MAYKGLPGWVRRRKVTAGSYEILYNGEVVAEARLQPAGGWFWYMTDVDRTERGYAPLLNLAIYDIYAQVFYPQEQAMKAALDPETKLEAEPKPDIVREMMAAKEELKERTLVVQPTDPDVPRMVFPHVTTSLHVGDPVQKGQEVGRFGVAPAATPEGRVEAFVDACTREGDLTVVTWWRPGMNREISMDTNDLRAVLAELKALRTEIKARDEKDHPQRWDVD